MKKLILSALLFLSFVTFNSQELLEVTFEGTLPPTVSDFEILDDGFLMVGSYTTADFDSIEAFLLKTDLDLNIEWSKTYQSLVREDFSKITSLSDGNFLIGGASRAQFLSEQGAIVYKVNSEGNVIWVKNYINDPDYRILDMFEREDGSLAIFIREGVSNKPTIFIHADADGEIIDQFTYYNESLGVFAENVIEGPSETYYLTGSSINGETGLFEIFLTQLSVEEMLFYKRYSMEYSVSTYGLDYSSDGDLIITGNIATESDFIQNSFAIVMDPTGSFFAAKEFSIPNESQFVGKIIPHEGSFTILGRTNDFEILSGLTLNLANDLSSAVSSKKYSSFASQNFGHGQEISEEFSLAIAGTPSGAYLVKMFHNGTSACSDEDVEIAISDLMVTEYDLNPTVEDPELIAISPDYAIANDSIASVVHCTSNQIIENDMNTSFSVWPNPVVNKLYLEFTDKSFEEIYITDLSGKITRTYPNELTSGKYVLSTANLSSGIYIVEVRKGDGVFQKKIVKL